jgi:hypothetical protein
VFEVFDIVTLSILRDKTEDLELIPFIMAGFKE